MHLAKLAALFVAPAAALAAYYPPFFTPVSGTYSTGQPLSFSWNQTIPDGIDPATVPQISEPRLGFLVPVEDADGNVVGHTPYYQWSLYTADNQLIYKIPLYDGPNVVNFTIAYWFPPGDQYVIGWIDATYPNTVNSSVFTIVDAQ